MLEFFFLFKTKQKKKRPDHLCHCKQMDKDTFSVLYNRLAMGNTVVKDVCKTIGRFDKSV